MSYRYRYRQCRACEKPRSVRKQPSVKVSDFNMFLIEGSPSLDGYQTDIHVKYKIEN